VIGLLPTNMAQAAERLLYWAKAEKIKGNVTTRKSCESNECLTAVVYGSLYTMREIADITHTRVQTITTWHNRGLLKAKMKRYRECFT